MGISPFSDADAAQDLACGGELTHDEALLWSLHLLFESLCDLVLALVHFAWLLGL